jgi:GcrA cell cycle regulator
MTHHNAERGPWLAPGINERLIELHALTGMEAMSMGEIAAKLSFEYDALITRNAVIGRCGRLCLPLRPSGRQTRPRPGMKRKSRKRSPRSRKRFEEPIAPLEALPNQTDDRPLTIYQLNQHNCHWPLGEFEDRPPYLYCGKVAAREGCFWCPEHYSRTHVVARER